MKSGSRFKKYLSKPMIVLWIILVFIVFTSVGNHVFYDSYLKEKLNEIDAENAVLLKRDDSLKTVITGAWDSITTILNKQEKTYYYEYLSERRRRIKAQEDLRTIHDLVFDRHYLDSLSKSVEFPE